MPTLEENLDRLELRNREVIRVRVVNVDISFLQMVWLLIKFAIAAIPAAIIFGLLVALVTALVGAFGGSVMGLFNGFHWI